MRFHRSVIGILVLLLTAMTAWAAPAPQASAATASQTGGAGPGPSAQNPTPSTPQPGGQAAGQVPSNLPVIREQTNVVRVDAVVTDKKGNYVHDLERKDFRVWEDGKEQAITAFSSGAGTPLPNAPQPASHIVLFFDNASMETSDQARARQAALQFVQKAAAPDRQMAVVEFGGTLRVAQNFTSDAARLADAVRNVKPSAVHSNMEAGAVAGQQGSGNQVIGFGGGSFTDAGSDFAARTILLALRDLCLRMAAIPGRKSLILFTSGFPLTPDRQSEVAATIDAANKANVAIYPLDVRGLTNLGFRSHLSAPADSPRRMAQMVVAAYHPDSGGNPWSVVTEAAYGGALLDGQHGGGGGGHGGGGGSGGHGGGGTGSPGGGVGTNQYNSVNALNLPRQIVPPFPLDASANQQVLYELASGTGGFPILNTNDLLSGMAKIAHELDEYYVLGYALPERGDKMECHTIKVKVERGGSNVRARSGYCDAKSSDVLAGKPEGTALETRAASGNSGKIPVTLQAPFFYTTDKMAHVEVSLELPGNALKFAKEKTEMHSELDVLGIVYRPDGSVAGRFSDAVKFDVTKDQMEELAKKPFQYQNTFELPTGNYKLKVALSASGEDYASAEMPLSIDGYDGTGLGISGVVLSNNIHAVGGEYSQLDSELMEGRKFYVVKGMQLEPSVTNQFAKRDNLGFYTELYDARLADPTPPKVVLIFAVLDRKTNKAVFTAPVQQVNQFAVAGNPVIPVALKLPTEHIPPGDYRLEVRAGDEKGSLSLLRRTNFTLN
jgi:VWFA-related protein